MYIFVQRFQGAHNVVLSVVLCRRALPVPVRGRCPFGSNKPGIHLALCQNIAEGFCFLSIQGNVNWSPTVLPLVCGRRYLPDALTINIAYFVDT